MTSIPSELAEELAALESSGRRRVRRTVEPLPEGRCQVNDSLLWNFAGNDYLGIADHPLLIQSAAEAMHSAGVGARASPLVSGRTQWHDRLEARFSQFKHAEAAILFPTGFAANLGVLTALAGPEDVILCDRLNHASLIDGSRLSKARLRVVPHCDVEACRKQLQNAAGSRRRFIVTDSVFSMDGDHAPLAELAQLADAFDAVLIVDEAHATGVFGAQGRGLLEDQHVPDSDRIVAVSTLSKAMGLQGGIVTGCNVLIEWLWNSARSQMFSTGLSVPVCGAALAAIDLIENEPHRRDWLKKASSHVLTSLREQGWEIPEATRGPIIPVLIGDDQETMRLSARLQEAGVLVAGIRPPTVPPRTSRLRISLSFAHGSLGIEALIQAFSELSRARLQE